MLSTKSTKIGIPQIVMNSQYIMNKYILYFHFNVFLKINNLVFVLSLNLQAIDMFI
jgi:hypothetical protein